MGIVIFLFHPNQTKENENIFSLSRFSTQNPCNQTHPKWSKLSDSKVDYFSIIVSTYYIINLVGFYEYLNQPFFIVIF